MPEFSKPIPAITSEMREFFDGARAGRLIFPGRMERWHQRWLEGLAAVAGG